MDARLVNVGKASEATAYVALSYVWGGVKFLQTTMKNLKTLSRSGSLRRHWRIPRVMRDAMTLVKGMGLRYL